MKILAYFHQTHVIIKPKWRSMKNKESINVNVENSSFASSEETSNHEQLKTTLAVNIHNAKDNFFDDAEIVDGREADSVCRKSKPNVITNVESYEEIMNIEPNASEPLETRFSNIDKSDFPIFSKQAIYYGSIENHEDHTINIDEACSKFVGETIRAIDAIEDSDLVIYLDKSARPASWFVNEFWEEFSDKDRPAEANLAIDRMQWFRWAGVPVDANGNINDNGTVRKAVFRDFEDAIKERKPDDYDATIANIRALFIPGGVETEKPEEIMQTPTGLESKKITIVDEVKNSGSTLDIAKWLINQAINRENGENNNIKAHTFWHLPELRSERDPSKEPQMNHAPVWYDPAKHDDWSGRGVLDINTGYFENNYQTHPDSYTFAQKLGSIVLGEPMNIDEEPGQKSWQLQEEIREMHKEYRKGHILPNLAYINSEAIQDRVIEYLEQFGVIFAGENANHLDNAKRYTFLMSKINYKSPSAKRRG